MKGHAILLGAAWWLLGIFNVPATLFYVDVNSTNPVPPYAGWSTASTDIQSAIDASSDGDLILVTNGVYATGGRVVYGSLTNRVVINKAVTVQSVNGPLVTVIQGYQVPGTLMGDAAIRCVYLTNWAVLTGFTLTNGATRSSGDKIAEQSGGGVWCDSTNGFISDCTIIGNSALVYGSGDYSGTLNNCQIMNNTNGVSLLQGGGVAFSTLYNCSITGNYKQVLNGGVSGEVGGAFSCYLRKR